MDDRRQNDRFDAYDAGLRVVEGIDGAALGIIGNLSPGGMMLITTRQLYAGGILQLRIEPPPAVGGNPISLGMKVLWCSPASSPNEYWAGLETIDIASSDRDALRHLLDHLADDQ